MPKHTLHCRLPRGFTLIELMISVAIIGILSAVAVPIYNNYITRGRLADASTGLATLRAQMERYYQDNRTYASVGDFTTPCATTNTASRTFGYFVISCSGTPSATAFTLMATGSGSVSSFAYTINQSDVRATTSLPSDWGSVCASKWIMKKGDSC
jgi:type IV pilus assembly protein PilE